MSIFFQKQVSKKKKKTAADKKKRRNLSILIVDDNRVNLIMEAEILHKFGYLADVESDAEQVLKRMGEKKYDLAEFVIVVINLRAAVIFQVKESEILQQVSALFIVFVHDGLHKSIFCKEYSIDCVYFARRAQ